MKLISGKGNSAASKSSSVKKSNGTQNSNTAVKPKTKPKATAVPKQDVSAPPRKRKKRTGLKVAIIIVLVLVLSAVGAVAAFGFYVDNLGTVFPNVWADGVNLSGLTLAEANRTLIDSGFESNADNASATVNFSNGTSFTIFGNEVGLSLNAEEAALAAFYIGRNGSFFDNIRTYIHSRVNITDLRNVSVANMDVEHVREVVSRYTLQFNNALLDGSVNIGEDSIKLVIGTGLEAADEEYVFDLTVHTIYAAMDEQAHLTVEVVTGVNDEVEVDLEMLYARISVEPVSSYLDRETFTATESSQGLTFDMAAAQAALDRAQIGEEIVIPLIVLEPEVTEEEVISVLFRDVLGTRTTSAAGSASGRLNNIRISSESINGTVLLPGEVFSFNEVVGPRTGARGFQYGGAFVDGELVPAIGGGICQTSSTLYNAILYAGLEIVQRRPHTYIVTYLPFGLDATIVWGSIDLRFRNTTDYPIRIETAFEGTDLTMSIIGTETRDYTIRLRSVTLSSVAIQTIERVDEGLELGATRTSQPGSIGVTAEVFRARIDADGNVIDEELLGRDVYRMMNRIVLVNPHPEEDYDDDPYGQDPPDDQPEPPDQPDPPDPPDPPDEPPDEPEPPEPPEDDPADDPQPPPDDSDDDSGESD
jgi:vancomycin resistance protein YoaR